MRYWTFNADTCRFERGCAQSAAPEAIDVAVISDNIDLWIVHENQSPKRWPSGERLIVAGVPFEREQFE